VDALRRVQSEVHDHSGTAIYGFDEVVRTANKMLRIAQVSESAIVMTGRQHSLLSGVGMPRAGDGTESERFTSLSSC
jgi:hypothetical protein